MENYSRKKYCMNDAILEKYRIHTGWHLDGEREDMMQVTVSINEAGAIVLANAQGDILAECFFRAEDETPQALRDMGYQRLVHAYPSAHITTGTGIDREDLGDVFLEL
jgi:hypothetical protein